MNPDPDVTTSWSVQTRFFELFKSDERTGPFLAMLLSRLMVEVEALREALSSPETPESVRAAYRQAYERIAVLSHNAAGPSSGMEKVSRRYFAESPREGRFAGELKMLARLGASEEEREAIARKMEEVEMYT